MRTTDWPYKPDARVIDKIRLKEPSCDIDICLEDLSNFVVDVLTEKKFPFEKWERFNSVVKYKRTLAFLLRWLPFLNFFRSSILETTDPCEVDIAEQKLIYVSHGEIFPSELKLLRYGKIITENSQITKYSLFIDQLASFARLGASAAGLIPISIASIRLYLMHVTRLFGYWLKTCTLGFSIKAGITSVRWLI